MTEQITLGRYLFEKIKEAGSNSIFGVPGDFNLTLLDHIKEVDGLRWVGNANELNAGYAADGYSRVNGFTCLITTFGVGELSAANAQAGAYAERIPFIHVVGMPSTKASEKKLLLHHTLGNNRFDDFSKMFETISAKSAVLETPEGATDIINDLIETAILSKRPTYLGLPSNFSEILVPASYVAEKKLKLSLPPNNESDEEEFVDNVIELVKTAENPIIIVDACANRHALTSQVEELAKLTKFSVYTTPMGKSSFNEDSEAYHGIYIGELSAPDVKEKVESADCIISVGSLLSDFNTGSFSYDFSTKNIVEFHSTYCKFKRATYDNLQMDGALKTLLAKLPSSGLKFEAKNEIPASKFEYETAKTCPEGKLTQEYLWKRLSYFLKEDDIVVTETGTSSFGIYSTHLTKNVKTISQVLWGSIGYSLPAAVGAAFAADDLKTYDPAHPERRVILFIGDGSIQLTVQAISDACRWNIKPYIFVLNNNGYTIEKLIHGPEEEYNNIQPWDIQSILSLFADKAEHETLTVKTCADLDELYNCEKFNVPDKIRLIELMLDEMDAPQALVAQAELSSRINSA